ncbi:PTS sugar transporter subunit IIB [Carnobacterium gallinarum]|uniref:PTS sugar transporter subunit IIB n=1 Tax=Carnobacterium gallinarum TaxID=2749 RepID=UPI0005566C83|nr:PTS sugar transporter subunit IIB [Carnobacterium gallinarum]
MSKKKIYLFCDAGMSTSIMVNKMQAVADQHQMPLEISAYPVARAIEVVTAEKPICILLGPQVRFLLPKITEQFEPLGIPVGGIDPEIYGMMDGEKALKSALKLIKSKKQSS